MGRVLAELDALDRALQSRPAHPLLGVASLHASLIHGGRELSSYPDRCHLQMERRTIPGEEPGCAGREVASILSRLEAADPEFRAASRALFARSPYEIAAGHPLVAAMQSAAEQQFNAQSSRFKAEVTGMSFWTDASVLGDAGIPSLLFGPAGAGLHGVEEWVDVASVLACRDALVTLARTWCSHA
jgi:acetylornithine deacetylase